MSNILISTPPTSLATGLLQLDGGVAISSTPVYVADQNNTDSSLAISTNNIGIGTNNPTTKLQINGLISSNFLKLALSSDVTQYFSAYLGSAPNLWDIGPVADDQNTILRFYRNNYALFRVGSVETMRIVSNKVGINLAGATPSAVLQAKGTGSTSATTSLLIQDSAGTNAFYVRDDRFAWFSKDVTMGGSSSAYVNIGTGGSNNPYINAFGNGLQITTSNSYGANSSIQIQPALDWHITNTTTGVGFQTWSTNGAERMRLLANGNFLIATTTDAGYKLAVNGDAQINTLRIGLGAGSIASNTALGYTALNSNTTGANNVAVGYESGLNNTIGTNIVAVGLGSARANTTGTDNTAIGKQSLLTNQTGNYNTALGANALRSTTSTANTGIGYQALNSTTTGFGNASLGYASLYSNLTGDYSVAMGYESLYNNTASNNTAYGYQSGYSNTSGTNLTAIGWKALRASTGAGNTAVGYEASAGITSGTNNTSMGFQSLLQNTTGTYNVAIGMRSLYVSATGTNNTAIGSLNSALNNSGSYNVSVGYGTHYSNTTGSSNTLIGYNAQSTNFDSSVVIGRDASATASNQFVVGSASYNAGTVTTEINTSTKVWNVKINGVDYKILLA